MLTQNDVVPYLMQRKLLSAEAIVDGNLSIVDASRRNRNFKVASEQGPCLLLKQGVGAERMATISNEATVYQNLLAKEGLGRYLPSFYGYDPEEAVLILELLPDAQ